MVVFWYSQSLKCAIRNSKPLVSIGRLKTDPDKMGDFNKSKVKPHPIIINPHHVVHEGLLFLTPARSKRTGMEGFGRLHQTNCKERAGKSDYFRNFSLEPPKGRATQPNRGDQGAEPREESRVGTWFVTECPISGGFQPVSPVPSFPSERIPCVCTETLEYLPLIPLFSDKYHYF